MQISKSLLIGCATALLVSPLSLRADDTEAQAKAREALKIKMQEMQTRPPGMPVAPEPVVKPSQAEQQKEAEQAKADKAAAEKARKDEEKARKEAEKAKKEEQRKAEQAAKEAKKPAPTGAQPTETVQPNEPAQTTVTAQTAAPAAETKPADQTKNSDNSSKKSEPAAKKPEEAKAKKPAAFPPLQGPPSPLSADKQQRLSELNRKYLADQITPAEYHAERAKIIAEP